MASRPLMKEQAYEDNDLESSSDSYEERELTPKTRSSSRWRSLLRIPVLLHSGFIILYTILFVIVTRASLHQACTSRDLVHSPARSALKYEKQVFHSDVFTNPFAGKPRPELDEAWHGLLENIHIKVPKSDIDAINDTTLALADGSGYVGSLEVYHDLHCLKRIRHFIYKDYYLPNMTQEELDFQTFHTEHCLEHFRELVMCRGDISLTTFYYRRHEVTAKLLAEHECVNWESLEGWVKERAIDLSIPGIVEPEKLD